MNIFVVDNDPVVAGTVLCDKHIVKMPLETAQMLCTAVNKYGGTSPYKSAYVNHPCTQWASSSYDHFLWLCTHGDALCWEYRARYGRRHKCHDVIQHCRKVGRWLLPRNGWTTHPQCMPDEYHHTDVVTAYRQYYQGDKAYMATWKQNMPEWWNR